MTTKYCALVLKVYGKRRVWEDVSILLMACSYWQIRWTISVMQADLNAACEEYGKR